MRTMQKVIVWMVIGVAFHFCMIPAAAAPSLTGSTGMIRIPTADALQLGQYSAGYYYWKDHGDAVAAVGLPSGMEVSAFAPWENGISDAWIVNAKYNLNQEALLIPAVSIGMEDIGGQGRRSVYGVISKVLPYGFRIHIGIGTGRFDGMFGAIEKVLNPTPIRKKASGFPVTSIIIEMDGAKLNYGARLRLAQGLRLDTGWLGQDEKMYLGLTFTH
ncbi:MAG: protein of unknown function rane lipoprotein [Firmicutes bacterium]|nr:protein of unknown function rane lipoprotein [Bacillota bacterium]